MRKNKAGFTLIEILVVIGIIAILATIVIIAINPARQFAQARDTQRRNDVTAILNAIGQNMADNDGLFDFAGCPATAFPASSTEIGTGALDLEDCIVPTYISSMPIDPEGDAAGTGYFVHQDSVTDRISVRADDTEIASPDIEVTR